MKRKCLLFIIACFVLLACKEKDTGFYYQIEGNLQNINSPEIRLVSYTSPDIILDTIHIDNGKFLYKNSLDSLQPITLYMEDDKVWITIWTRNGDKVKVSGDIHYPELLLIEGGDINDLLTGFKARNKDRIKKRQDLQETLQFNMNESLNTQTNNDIYSEILKLNQEIKDDALLFIEQHPESVVSLVLIQDYVLNYETPEKILHYLSSLQGEARTNPLYDILYDLVVKLNQTALNRSFPDFSLVDTKADTLTLDSFTDNYLLLNFYSSSYDSCRHYMEDLKSIYTDNPAFPLNVLAVSLGCDSLDLKDLSKKAASKWYCIMDKNGWNSPIVKACNPTMITDNYLIDKDRKLIARNISPDSIKTLINMR